MSSSVEVLDPTFYPVEDDMGEHELQTYILELLRPLLERFLESKGMVAHVGSDQFFYWRQFAPTDCLAPDLYVLPGVPQDIAIASWKVWERGGVVPSFALEVVTGDWKKDYTHNLSKYEQLGVEELLVVDPFVEDGPARTRWQRFRRMSDGVLVQEEMTDEASIYSPQLEVWFRMMGQGAARRVRLATGRQGDTLFPDPEEARAQAEAAQQRAEAAQQRAEAAQQQAEARCRELERQLRAFQDADAHRPPEEG
ncbi:MAG: Uma2 family endonuclease [Myxococcota bacterium]